MASITSLMNSSAASSIYGNRNILTGLASGMDTESMIENAVSGIKLKIQNLLKKRTKVEWQQDAYRSIIDKAVNLSNKYTSYSSKTNLLSSSFFSNAVLTTTNGTYADKITASGKTSSDIKINSVKQMATAATYTVSGAATGFGSQFASNGDGISGISGDLFDLSKNLDVSTVSGSMTLKYGGTNGTSFDLTFDEMEDWSQYEGSNSAEKLANAINRKLSETTYSYTKNGYQETTTADKAIKAVAKDGQITFTDALGNGNTITVGSASGNLKNTLGISDDGEDKVIKVGSTSLSRPTKTSNYLAGKSLNINYNGTTKTINMNDVLKNVNFSYDDDSGKSHEKQFSEALQAEVDKAFGKGKLQVDWWDPDEDNPDPQGGRINITPTKEGDTLSVSGSAVKALGFESGDANYLNTSRKLSDLMGDDIFSDQNKLAAVGSVRLSSDGKYSLDAAGNRVSKGDDGQYYRVNNDGEFLYNFQINGANINVTKNTTLESLMNTINSNPDAGVKVSYSKLTNEFKFTATETGSNSKIEFGGLAKDMFVGQQQDVSGKNFAETFGMELGTASSKQVTLKVEGLADVSFRVNADDTVEDVLKKLNDPKTSLFAHDGNSLSINELTGELVLTDKNGATMPFSFEAGGKELTTPVNASASYTAGQDAIMDVEINGKRFENFTRSSNSFDVDGLTINVKGTFNEDGTNIDKDGNKIEPVTFTTTTDSDKIVDAIRDFVNDYNEMITELKGAYSTMPLQQTSGARYEPLTAEQEDSMTESELKAYNEKAQTGILFGDTTLSSMYGKLLNAIQPGGTDGQTLREIGIGTNYENGLTTISLDEDKLRAALESNPDKVKDAFTKSKEGGASSDGLMTTLQNTLNTYVKTTGEPKGVLITKAGSIKAPTSLNSNSLKSQMDSIDKQIERYETRMSNQIDRYTTQFSRLEQLIAQMNSQASMFSGLMGGMDSGGY